MSARSESLSGSSSKWRARSERAAGRSGRSRIAGFRAPLLVCLLLLGCGETTAPSKPATPGSHERQIAPEATDPGIRVNLEPHIAISPSPSVRAAGKLFVFLPGTGAEPSMYRLILRTGAARGYHAIGLTYPNDVAVAILCGEGQGESCAWDVRREVITGSDTSPLVQVDPANSIVNRLEKLLSYMQAHYPNEGWGQYLSQGSVIWSRVVVAGHSQGGGHAAAMAKLFEVDRAVFFAAPADWNVAGNAPAAWFAEPGLTDASSLYGFSHVVDPTVPYVHLTSIWPALGLDEFGPAVLVDDVASPYQNSHMLKTKAAPRSTGTGSLYYHGATVMDAVTPVTPSGTPVYAAVWIYLCFP